MWKKRLDAFASLEAKKGKRRRLIDWEDLALIDPVYKIAIIFDSFDFSDRQKELFLEEYSKARKKP